jgi:UDP-glucose 4-epimerase
VVLRYFNAAGADPEGRIGEWHSPETHAIPLAVEAALGRRASFKVFGSDYDTRDGTCVRDFVHVMDLADAHSRAVRYLLDGGDSVALNLGTGEGTTVSELLAAIEHVSGRRFPVEHVKRRDGDSPALVADNAKAKSVLGWAPSHDLTSIVETAWNWHSRAKFGAEQ